MQRAVRARFNVWVDCEQHTTPSRAQFHLSFSRHMILRQEDGGAVKFSTKCQIISSMFLHQSECLSIFFLLLKSSSMFFFFCSLCRFTQVMPNTRMLAVHASCMMLCIWESAHDAEQIKTTFIHIRAAREVTAARTEWDERKRGKMKK